MPGKIVVFGATGYTGRLVAEALVAKGSVPVLAARSRERLGALSESLRGAEAEVADAGDAGSLRRLVGRGDVLVSTVGPFTRVGGAALEAAIDAGAHYVDSTGEASFIRQVFQDAGPRAAQGGSIVLTAFGYDYVPGNLAGALALSAAGAGATSVDIGYFVTGHFSVSSGTRASVLASGLLPSFAFREGRVVEEPALRRPHRFDVGGMMLPAASIGGSEGFSLPRSFPMVRNVGTYLGALGRATMAGTAASYLTPALAQIPGRDKAVELAMRKTGSGPDQKARARAGSRVLATASDDDGMTLETIRLEGVDPYTFTGNMIAWAAARLAEGNVEGSGALGPVEAFGLEELTSAVREAGIERVERP